MGFRRRLRDLELFFTLAALAGCQMGGDESMFSGSWRATAAAAAAVKSAIGSSNFTIKTLSSNYPITFSMVTCICIMFLCNYLCVAVPSQKWLLKAFIIANHHRDQYPSFRAIS